jgi:T4 RnlA family RNA ligase
MFRLDDNGDTKLVCMPPRKFWNVNEVPFTQGINLEKTVRIMDKADGSLISTFYHNDRLEVKSKGSLSSDHAQAARLYLEEYSYFRHELWFLAKSGYTVNMELCSPDLKIVLQYDETHLKVFSIIDNFSGEYMDMNTEEFKNNYPNIWDRRVYEYDLQGTSVVSFLETMVEQDKIEGVVMELGTDAVTDEYPALKNKPILVKVKAKRYLEVHGYINVLNSPRRLYMAVLEEKTDDMVAILHDLPGHVELIRYMEEYIRVEMERINEEIAIFVKWNENTNPSPREMYEELCKHDLPGSISKNVLRFVRNGTDYNLVELMIENWDVIGKPHFTEKDTNRFSFFD